MYFLFKLYLILLLLIVTKLVAENVVSDDDKQDTRKDKNTYSKLGRRFLEDLDDKEWHVSHLKDANFGLKSGCPEDTFEDKLKKYRESLRKDGALVDFVSANALPFNVSDSYKVCKVPVEDIGKNSTTETSIDTPDNVVTRQPDSTVGVEKEILEEENKATEYTGTANVATTTKKSGRKRGKKEKKARRDNEYAFSSVEYYEEEPFFNEAVCPDQVEVINLEIDVIRNYDLRCEQILMWKSLE